MTTVEGACTPERLRTHPINHLLLLHGGLLLGFDYLPGPVRLALAGGLLLGYALLALGAAGEPPMWRDLAPLGVLALCWALATVLQMPLSQGAALDAALRQLATYAALLALLAARERIAPGVLLALASGILLSGLIHAWTLPPEVLNGRPRWAPFSSNLHSSGYGVVAALLILWHLRGCGAIGLAPALAMAVGLVALMLGNGVRTPVLFLASFALLIAVMPATGDGSWRVRRPSVPALFALLVLAALAGLALLLPGAERLDDLASGRLSNYAERFRILWARSPAGFMIGAGPGSDLMRTSVWWWDEKGSHSDLLKTLWEAGLLGLLAVLWFWAGLAARFGGAMVALSGAVLVSSAVSNAYLARPNAAFLVFACVAARIAWQERQARVLPAAVPAGDAR